MTEKTLRNKAIALLMLLTITMNMAAQDVRGNEADSIPFTIGGLRLGEAYTETVQRELLKGALVNEINTEYGIDRAFIFGGNGNIPRYSYFNFSQDELREVFICSDHFSLDLGKIQLRLGDPIDKLKAVPQLVLEQAIMWEGHIRKPQEGRWVLQQPNLCEDYHYIVVYEDDGIVVVIHGCVVP
ncbi:hypothetical protein [Porphyromonas loveana]|uniref:hypothetical protein n=1 Tax=Porphyromonas loveana TaxID=1884669 RepID=UPI00359FC937